jgi:hypothetical protein
MPRNAPHEINVCRVINFGYVHQRLKRLCREHARQYRQDDQRTRDSLRGLPHPQAAVSPFFSA